MQATTLRGNVGGAAGAAGIDAGNGRIVNLSPGINGTDAVNLNQLTDARSHADAGTAIAVALSGIYFLPGKHFNLSANFGSYRGQSAVAANVGILIGDSVGLNAGVSTGLNQYGGTAVRGGVTFGF